VLTPTILSFVLLNSGAALLLPWWAAVAADQTGGSRVTPNVPVSRGRKPSLYLAPKSRRVVKTLHAKGGHDAEQIRSHIRRRTRHSGSSLRVSSRRRNGTESGGHVSMRTAAGAVSLRPDVCGHPSGDQIELKSENGVVGDAKFTSPISLTAPAPWNSLGVIAPDGHVEWSNGTAWRRN